MKSATDAETPSFVAFAGVRRIARGSIVIVAQAVAAEHRLGRTDPLLVFDAGRGHVVDVDWRGTDEEIALRYAARERARTRRGPGRPRLGVVSREVTLLPAHWEWLAGQSGGASVTLRKLIERARKSNVASDRQRMARDAAYRFLHAIGGDLPGFKEVSRALFAGDHAVLRKRLARWPDGIRTQVFSILED